ncbi:metabolite traffic protein EboE [Nocardioides sp. 1609]|uniref:metabolite traffic protein EboE n=1 Tax=Nocardioides sp. 1609 TaxID=2508327 RepID=UPI00106F9B3E|nr:metabolite traffic protein EboE [Nocardioides sp. 1609]
MRFRHRDGSLVHLSYGSNVHPAETVDGIIAQLRTYAAGVRSALDADVLGVGLWLPAAVAHELAEDRGARDRVRQVLRAERLEVVTVNAFPYRGFHDDVVKKAVYHPDWTEDARLTFTLDCARVLADLLPDEAARGSVSTLPLGWRTPWDDDQDRAAADLLHRLSDGLATLADDVGRPVRVGLEPEPGCVVETAADAVERLAWLADLGPGLVGVCVDTCHLAVGFEEVADALVDLGSVGLPVVKVQASAALHAARPADDETRAALEGWAEGRFLHQTREPVGAEVSGRDDLDEALGLDGAGGQPLPARRPWRVHVHVPVHADPEPPLRSTRPHLEAGLTALLGGDHPVVDHVEVETYTWGVLPLELRPRDDAGLVAGIAAELAWARDRLVALGLDPVPGLQGATP